METKNKHYSKTAFPSSKKWMKLNSILIIVIILFSLSSCRSPNKNDETSLENNKDTVNNREASNNHGSKYWDDFNGNMQEFERDLEVTVKEAEVKFNNLSEELQKKYEGEKERIALKKAELDKKFEEFQNSSEEKQKELKSEVLSLKKAYDKSIYTFGKKIEKSRK